MPFIIIPICYVEGAPTIDEEDEITLIRKKSSSPPKVLEADVTINTSMICSYIGDDSTGHTLINMANGDVWECTHEREAFDALIMGADVIVDMSDIREN